MSQLTLGKIIKLLELEKPDNECHFDFCGFYPSKLSSWRGVYAHLAFEYKDRQQGKVPIVADVLLMCRNAIGKTFTGWKGGDFTMDESTPLWVSNSGDAHATAVVGVSSCGYGYTYLDTAYMEYH